SLSRAAPPPFHPTTAATHHHHHHITTTGIALTRTSRLLRPQYCLICPHAHRFAFVFLAWDFQQVTQTSATLTQARSTASSWQCLSRLRGVDYLLDKVVSVGTAPRPNSSDHNVNTITNGDGMPRMRTFRETIFPK
ncbi:hypothetical protein Tco_0160416, partial [Tanacetum coccineum]